MKGRELMAMCETCGKTIPAAGRRYCEACRKIEEAKAIATGEFQRCGNCATQPCGKHRDDDDGGCTNWTWLDLFVEVKRLRKERDGFEERVDELEAQAKILAQLSRDSIDKGVELLGLPPLGGGGQYCMGILIEGIRTLQEQVMELEQKVCDECDGDGWVEERPGRRPCICVEESGP